MGIIHQIGSKLRVQIAGFSGELQVQKPDLKRQNGGNQQQNQNCYEKRLRI